MQVKKHTVPIQTTAEHQCPSVCGAVGQHSEPGNVFLDMLQWTEIGRDTKSGKKTKVTAPKTTPASAWCGNYPVDGCHYHQEAMSKFTSACDLL